MKRMTPAKDKGGTYVFWQESLYLQLRIYREGTCMNIILVMIGGFLGATCRFTLGEWIHMNNGFPLGTLLINLSGCFILGWFLTYVSQNKKIRPEFTLIVGTGFIGSFTTFSTFSVETLNLFQNGLIFMAILYVLASAVLGIVLAYAGHHLAVTKRKRGNVI